MKLSNLISVVCQQHPAGRVVLWVVLSDLCVLTSWQLLDPLKWVVLQHGSQVTTLARISQE